MKCYSLGKTLQGLMNINWAATYLKAQDELDKLYLQIESAKISLADFNKKVDDKRVELVQLSNKAWEYKQSINQDIIAKQHHEEQIEILKRRFRREYVDDVLEILQKVRKSIEEKEWVSIWLNKEIELLEKRKGWEIERVNKAQDAVLNNEKQWLIDTQKWHDAKRELEKEIEELEKRKRNAIFWIERQASRRKDMQIMEKRLKEQAAKLWKNINL